MIKFANPFDFYCDLIDDVWNNRPFRIRELYNIGSRYSCKTFSAEQFAGIVSSIPHLRENVIATYLWRYSKKDGEELYDDCLKNFTKMNLKFKAVNSKQCFYINGQEIRVKGLNSLKKNAADDVSGLATAGNVKYIIIIFEEAYQFTMDEILKIKEAIRGNNQDVSIFTAYIANPWKTDSWLIRECINSFRFDEKLLRSQGYQYKLINRSVGEGYFIKKLFLYVNWRANKIGLSTDKIADLLDTWNWNPARARVADLGMPGIEEGSVYGHVIKFVNRNVYYVEHTNLRGGLDWGWGTGRNSSKTACVFMGSSFEKKWNNLLGIDVYDIYVNDSSKVDKSHNIIYNEIVDFFYRSMRIYLKNVSMNSSPNLMVYCDRANQAVIDALNDICYVKRIKWLLFVPCKKLMIEDRIEVTRYVMSKGLLRISKKADPLYDEFVNCLFKDSVKIKREDGNDDLINAFEYALESDHSFISNINSEILSFNKKNRNNYEPRFNT